MLTIPVASISLAWIRRCGGRHDKPYIFRQPPEKFASDVLHGEDDRMDTNMKAKRCDNSDVSDLIEEFPVDQTVLGEDDPYHSKSLGILGVLLGG
ncbi:hypothetical protein L210DRAFT_3639357 [Boletus edulis BED1]|uniref:Uncharacterized protein n=1 Tax=Boletus edulis BED1 TaxID=1328754 RepID=A0AAD4GMP1_BOLED|nr:hypothetical protein L210DRAFT_3639357 [Boletus edulis BED1]